ncbi:alkaline-phosphatase-like protein [Dipodascopsis uninucleata]
MHISSLIHPFKTAQLRTIVSDIFSPIAIMTIITRDTDDIVVLHGRVYKLPRQPTVVICVDGFDPEYLDQGFEDGIIPNLAKCLRSGFHATAKCSMPSVTNVNNVSIITGAPTAIHGIAGNFYLDRFTKEEHMVLDDTLLRGSTILEQLANKGVRVAAITAKDKLRRIISHGLSPEKGSICFSSQFAKSATLDINGIDNVEEMVGRPSPDKYSADLSMYVLDAGLKLLELNKADLFYLTLSDYIQHKNAPGSPAANEFMKSLDERVGKFMALGAVVAVTGDHGMSNKTDLDGKPNILFLEDELNKRWPTLRARVICPIIDPYVRHHGALGSFVRVHLLGEVDNINSYIEFCQSFPQVLCVHKGDEAAALYETPPEVEGDIVVIAQKNAVIGSRKQEHDLSNLADANLRSHGGLSEQSIPLIKSTPLNEKEFNDKKIWRNFDVFQIALN